MEETARLSGSIKVTGRTHRRLRDAAGGAGVKVGDLADMLLDHGLTSLEAGRLSLEPAALVQVEEGVGV